VFLSVSGSFKNMMIGQITDSMLGHVQVHRAGYVASIETKPAAEPQPQGRRKAQRAEAALRERDRYRGLVARRLKFGGMFSNFAETTNIRPERRPFREGVSPRWPLLSVRASSRAGKN